MSKIISNCPLCEAHGLHVMGEDREQVMQCLNCGYTSSENFIGTMSTNENFKKLPEVLQSWCKEENGRIWLPVQITLPIGMLYPINMQETTEDDDTIEIMHWAFAPMVDIPEEEQEKYPDGNGGCYKQRYDTENVKFYNTFLEGMSELNEKMKDAVSEFENQDENNNEESD